MKPAIRLLTFITAIIPSACASSSQVGAGAGEPIGSVIGAQASAVTRRAVIDAVIGGAAGGIIGRQMNNLAGQLRTDLPQAHIDRVGEGIIVTFSIHDLFAAAAEQPRSNAATLRTLATRVAPATGIELLVIADPDTPGASGNRELAVRRATAIKDALVRHGVAAARIIVSERPAQERSEQAFQIALYASQQYRDAIMSEYGRQ